MKNQFSGIYVALYSCFTSSGTVDSEAITRLVQHYINKGVHGLYVCGSTGEGLLMTVQERKRTLEAVMAAANNQLDIIVHVGTAATEEACILSRHAQQKGAHAISAIPSVYYRLSEESIEQHWAQMIKSTDLPFIIYNIPQLTGYSLTRRLFDRMLTYPQVIGIKNSSESIFDSMRFRQWGGEDFIIFHGMDEQYAAGRMMGANGGIGGTYGVMPELFLFIDLLIAENRLEEAKKVQLSINKIIEGLLSFGSLYGAAKEILRLQGIPIGKPRMPFLPITDDQMYRLEKLHLEIQQVILNYTSNYT